MGKVFPSASKILSVERCPALVAPSTKPASPLKTLLVLYDKRAVRKFASVVERFPLEIASILASSSLCSLVKSYFVLNVVIFPNKKGLS